MKYFLPLLLALSPLLAVAQTELLQQADQAFQAGDYTKAIADYKSAAPLFQQQQQWDNYLKCGVGIGYSQLRSSELDAAIATFDEYLKTGESNISQPNEQIALLYKGKGSAFYSKDLYKEAESFLEKALDTRQKATPDNPDLIRDFINMATIYRINNKLTKSTEQLKTALSIAKKTDQQDPAILGTLFENIGYNSYKQGKYQEAIEFFDRALPLFKGGDKEPLVLLNKGQTLYLSKNFKEALRELRKAISVSNTLPNKSGDVYLNMATAYSFISDTWLASGNIDSALYYGQQAFNLAQKQLKGTIYEPDYAIKMVQLLIKKNNITQAQSLLTQTQPLLAVLPQKDIITYNYHQTATQLHQATNNYPAAFQTAQQQIIALVEGFDNPDINSLPSEEQLQGAISLDYLTDALANKARVLYNAFKAKQAGQKELENALQTMFFFDKTVNVFRQQSDAEGTGLSWSELTLDAYANAMDICWELYQSTKSDQYLQHAFYFSEKSKALVLLEAFQKSKATLMTGLTTQELEQESNLKRSISQLERDLYALHQDKKNATANAASIQSMEKTLFDQRRELETLLKTFESKNPEYFKIKNNIQIADIQQVRSMLLPDQALVEFFIADSSCYVFKITGSEIGLYPIALQEQDLQKKVHDFRESIYGYYLGAERSDEAFLRLTQQYVVLGNELYQQLLAVAGNLPRRLMLVPANALCDLPFDALLTEQPADANQYKNHPYLLRKHIVAYCYSATLLQEMRNRQHKPTSGSLLAFAPEFGTEEAAEIRGERFALSPLAFNGTEVDKISDIVGNSKILKNKEALEPSFHELASQYRILHFATHGMANDKNPDYSLLAFTAIPDSLENEFLYVRELYDTELNADLVVLSACETGIGKLYRGEGIVSLARGFAHAGAKGIFTTLWSVNDQATSQIVESFYKYLAQGKDKDEALNLAKIDYINGGNNANTAPFLWAPFITIGDMRPIDGLGGGTPWWYWAAGAGALAVIAALVMKMRRREA